MQYIEYTLRNIEPLKIGAGGTKSNQREGCKEYIPGSAMRGAILSKLLKGTNKNFKYLTHVYFYNAYPYIEKKQYFPTPLHWRVDKHQWRENKINGEDQKLHNIAYSAMGIDESKSESNAVKNSVPYRFITRELDKDKTQGLQIEKTYRMHHSSTNGKNNVDEDSKVKKNDNSKDRDNIFRYEAIDKGYIFRGIIALDNEIEVKYIKACINEGNHMYIGGGRTSGYGKCEVVSCKVYQDTEQERKPELVEQPLPMEEEAVIKGTSKRSYTVVLTCLSDCLFRDKYGLPMGQPSDECIKQLFGDTTFNHCHSIVDSGITEGYNATWRARNPKETTIKAGSVFAYITTDIETVLNNSKSFQGTLHGEKTQEGYGWIGVCINEPSKLSMVSGVEESEPVKQELVNVEERSKSGSIDNRRKASEKNNNISIILKGLQEKKEDYVRELAFKELKSQENICSDDCRIKFGDELENKHLRRMREKLDNKDQGTYRDYMQDSDKFSIGGSNFEKLKKIIDGNDERGESPKIQKLLDHYLGSAETSHGQKKGIALLKRLYSEKGEIKRLHFLRDFAKELLYVKGRMFNE